MIRALPLRRWWISWIEAHRAEPFRVTDLAAALYVAPRTLQIAFREELGHPPLVEARRLRFRALRQALLNPRAPRRCLEALPSPPKVPMSLCRLSSPPICTKRTGP